MSGKQPDREGTRELARQVANDFGASLTVALGYIGDRLGLFRTIADAGPLTTQELADRTGAQRALPA
ncbi:MAG: hypothetical protein U5Q44_07405 [Dehalococcoidia bacterium]|nr:hypothetical protein [Dehalococcoidia bacterium]